MTINLEVVGAVIREEDRVLCAQSGSGKTLAGFWEFPGGKVEANESPSEALKREIREELACDIDVGPLIMTSTHEYEFGTITLATYSCRIVSGTPSSSEHEELRWVSLGDLETLQWAPADVPTVSHIGGKLSN
jgi:8-oxo-dGTP diphosphatase